MKKAAITILTAILTLGSVSVAYGAGGYGQSNCQVVYGGGEVCPTNIEFTIDKKVQQPTKGGDFVDNMSINDSKFQPGQDVAFKIRIQNTGNNKINTLNVTDNLPANVTFISGPGTFNKNNNTITYTISGLDPNAVNEQVFVARIGDSNGFNQNGGVACLTNTASATDNNGTQANDSAQFCVQTTIAANPTPQVFPGVPVKKVPETGPELFSLIGLIPVGIAGMTLRKKSRLKADEPMAQKLN